MQPEALEWAQEEFGDADLGDKRRTKRLIAMGACAAEQPSGRLTEVFGDGPELLAAYRYVENANVDPKQVGRAAFRATARRVPEGAEHVLVPVDGSTMAVPWATRTGAFGPLGSSSQGTRGMQVMNAIALLSDGTPLGLAGQSWWARSETKDKTGKKPKPNRPLRKKETQHWLRCINEVRNAHDDVGSSALLWFQLDAGADFGEMLHWAYEEESCRVTIRAAQDRRLSEEENGWIRYLWEKCSEQPTLATKTVHVGATANRTERNAEISISTAVVTVPVKDAHGCRQKVQLTAVLATEVDTAPSDEDPIEWLLLTNRSVLTPEDALEVLESYAKRWTIEPFHRVWKETCKAETNQFRTPWSLVIWSTILATVAIRIQRLTHLARTSPQLPATEELTQNEIDATIALQRPEGYRLGDVPTIGEAVTWIALQGGYRKRSGGPPGPKVIGRGLVRVEIAAETVASLRKEGSEM